MKQLIIITFLLFFSKLLIAQVGKGIFIGGNLEANMIVNHGGQLNKPTIGFRLGLNPKLGYFFNKNWGLGICGSGAYSRVSDIYASYDWNSGIFTRFSKEIFFEGRLSFWTELNLLWSYLEYWNFDSNGRSNIDNSANLSSGLSVGLIIFPKPNFGIEFGLASVIRYQAFIIKSSNQLQNGSLQFFGNASSLKAGIIYIIKKKNKVRP